MAINKETQIQAEINKLLLWEARERDGFVDKVHGLAERFGDVFYPHLLYTMAHLTFEKRIARKHWHAIVHHWEQMRGDLKRDINFRVALLDYFIDIYKKIKNPKIIEIKVFQKTQQETLIDELTQLYNYRYLIKAMNREISRANRYKTPLSFVFLDVDDFKCYNDTNGHFSGNKALKQLAGIMKKTVREVDIVARYGGEEFALVLPETNKDGGAIISERIRRRIELSKFIGGDKQPLEKITVSCGIATLNVDAATRTDLIKKADQALYRAKSRGKNQICLYEDEKRDFERVDALFVKQLSVVSDTGDIFIPKNISKGGMLFTFQRAISMGCIMQLFLSLPGRKTPILCKVKVKRVEEIKKNKKYEIGVRIIQIRGPDKKVLGRFIDSLVQSK